MEIAASALLLGLQYALLALGVYITFRVLNIPDLTVDGSFTFGAAVSAVLSGLRHRAVTDQGRHSSDFGGHSHHERSVHGKYYNYGCAECVVNRQTEIL